MFVKCQICKNSIDKKTAYCIENLNGTRKYYCSKEEYDNYIIARKQRDMNWDTIVEGYQYFLDLMSPPYGLVMSLIHDDKIKCIPMETLANFIKEFRDKIKRTVEKKIEQDGSFGNPWNQGRYVNGILSREITEKEWKSTNISSIPIEIKKVVDMEFYEPNMIDNGEDEFKRRPLDELEDLVDD